MERTPARRGDGRDGAVLLRDAQYMHALYPTSFEVPTNQQLRQIKVGQHVKVCAGRERFWVQITDITGFKITGRVDNDLKLSMEHGIVCNDVIYFERRHIYSTVVP